MKQLPNDVIVGGAYQLDGTTVYVTAVKPKGRGFYVDYDYSFPLDLQNGRMSLERFRRACNVNQREVA